MNVTHGYLAGKDGLGPLFATHHAPSAPARNIAYVLCLPLHLDLIQSHRSMRRCAEVLAEAGFHVLRLHYEGTTESVSSTDFDSNRVEAWRASVRRGIAAMAALPGVDGVGLIGVRIGGAFALDAATQVDVAQLVLWEPSPGNMYGREMEILASSAPQPSPSLGDGVVAGGYWLSKETLADLARLELEKMTPRGTPDVLLVHRSDRKPSPRLQQHLERHGSAVTLVQPAGHKEMMQMPQKAVVPDAILEEIRAYAIAHSRESSPGSSPVSGPELVRDVVVDELRWTCLRFGSANHLFGVLTEPAGGAQRDRPAVLLLTGGVTPRTAGNNSYVALARRLAKRGHSVLRMDVSFIGESGTPDGKDGRENDPFPPSILDDARAGIEQLSPKKLWLFGLCSGAYAAFHLAVAEERTVGVFVVNPERFEVSMSAEGAEEPGAPALSTADQLEQMNRYWQVMRSPEAWKKLLSGKADVRYLTNVLRARVGSRLEALKDRVAVRLGREPKGLAGDVARMLQRGVNVNFVFSEGDPGEAVVTTELDVRKDELERKGMHIKKFARADHNFHEVSSRLELLDWLETTICTAPG